MRIRVDHRGASERPRADQCSALCSRRRGTLEDSFLSLNRGTGYSVPCKAVAIPLDDVHLPGDSVCNIRLTGRFRPGHVAWAFMTGASAAKAQVWSFDCGHDGTGLCRLVPITNGHSGRIAVLSRVFPCRITVFLRQYGSCRGEKCRDLSLPRLCLVFLALLLRGDVVNGRLGLIFLFL